jgi:hypothetical protein
MKTIILIILAFLVSFKPAISDSTEVFIIGTVHYETDNFTGDSLYNMFTKIKPDLILLESDASYFTEDFKVRPGYENIANETRAVTKYIINNEVLLRPYDLEDRDRFLFNTNRRRTEREFFENLADLYEEGRLESKVALLTNALVNNMDEAQAMTFSTPFEINHERNREIIERINYYDFEAVSEIIKDTPDLKDYESYWKEVHDFWILRNNAMVDNIKKYINEYPGKRIIVLCGFAHKPYLLNGLEDMADNKQIAIKDYWDH